MDVVIHFVVRLLKPTGYSQEPKGISVAESVANAASHVRDVARFGHANAM